MRKCCRQFLRRVYPRHPLAPGGVGGLNYQREREAAKVTAGGVAVGIPSRNRNVEAIVCKELPEQVLVLENPH